MLSVLEEEDQSALRFNKTPNLNLCGSWCLTIKGFNTGHQVAHRFRFMSNIVSKWRTVKTCLNTYVVLRKLNGTYWLVILRLGWGGGSRYRHGYWSCWSGLRHHGRLDRGERMPGHGWAVLSLSGGRQLRLSSLGLYRSCRSHCLLPQSPTETVTELLYGNLYGQKEWKEMRKVNLRQSLCLIII